MPACRGDAGIARIPSQGAALLIPGLSSAIVAGVSARATRTSPLHVTLPEAPHGVHSSAEGCCSQPPEQRPLACPPRELLEHQCRPVGHQDDEVVACGAGDGLPRCLELVEDDIDLAVAAAAGGDRAL